MALIIAHIRTFKIFEKFIPNNSENGIQIIIPKIASNRNATDGGNSW